MNLRVIPRTFVEGYIRLVRLPLDPAIALLPGNGTGPHASVSLALDRADATARALAGVLLGDPELRADATRRRAAADERGRALRLRVEAERRTENADERLDEQHERSERERQEADARAVARRRRAERNREERKTRAVRAEKAQRATTRRAAARRTKAVDEHARKDRLDALRTKSDALREKEEALSASDEARRLARAAGQAKAARKRR